MPNIPASAGNVFWGVNSVITVSGYTYLAVSDITMRYGYKINEELVVGANSPYLGTGGFHGEFELAGLGSVDEVADPTVILSGGQLLPISVTWFDSYQGNTTSGRTYTISGSRIYEFERRLERDGVASFRLRGIMPAAPIRSGATT